MPLAALLLALAVPAATPTAAPQSTGPGGLSSYAGSVKVDRSKADALFRQDAAVAPAPQPGATSNDPKTGAPSSSSATPQSNEWVWRRQAADLRAQLESARTERTRAERALVQTSTSGTAARQRELLLTRYQDRINRIQASLDALAEQCRTTTGCQPGWVR